MTAGNPRGMKAASSRPRLLREINKRRVLLALRDFGPESRAGLARRTGISKVTVSNVAQGLIAEGLICEAGMSSRGIGRKATLLDLDRGAGVVAAADIAADQVHLVLASLRGRSLSERAFATPESLEALLTRFRGAVIELVQEAGVALGGILRLCVAISASVGPGNRIHISGAPRYLAELSRLVKVLPEAPLRFVNDMNMAAIGEQRRGAAKDWAQFAFLGVRKSGVGMGLVLNGQIYAGIHGRAGEIGLLRFNGQATALDALAEGGGEEVLGELSRVLVTTVALLDLEGVVFYTDFANGVDWLGQLEYRLAAQVPYPVKLIPSELGRAAPLQGALSVALEHGWRHLEGQMTSG